jgi:hypothetical protein
MRVRHTKLTAQRFPEFHVGTYCQISRGQKDVREESRIESHRYFPTFRFPISNIDQQSIFLILTGIGRHARSGGF